jgi:hypothetical protein
LFQEACSRHYSDDRAPHSFSIKSFCLVDFLRHSLERLYLTQAFTQKELLLDRSSLLSDVSSADGDIAPSECRVVSLQHCRKAALQRKRSGIAGDWPATESVGNTLAKHTAGRSPFEITGGIARAWEPR